MQQRKDYFFSDHLSIFRNQYDDISCLGNKPGNRRNSSANLAIYQRRMGAGSMTGKKALLFLTMTAATAAAAWYVMQGNETEEPGLQTAGDIEANIIEDGFEIMKSTFTQWPTGSEPYQGAITQAAMNHNVPIAILAWLLWKESRYNPAIISGAKRSPVGAMGIAQFMPATAKELLGSAEAALDPALAIPGAASYLAWLYNKLDTWEEALAAYNWGIGNVQRKGIENAPAETIDYYTTIISKSGTGGVLYA